MDICFGQIQNQKAILHLFALLCLGFVVFVSVCGCGSHPDPRSDRDVGSSWRDQDIDRLFLVLSSSFSAILPYTFYLIYYCLLPCHCYPFSGFSMYVVMVFFLSCLLASYCNLLQLLF